MRILHKVFRIRLALGLLLGLLGPTALPGSASPARLHPALAQVAAQAPEQVVGIIVQETGTSDRAERLVAHLGGTVTHDLSLIHAFAARLPAGAVHRLAASPGVRWVSPDAQLVSSGRKPADGGSLPVLNAYDYAVGANLVWQLDTPLQGQGVGVAVVDSGIAPLKDFESSKGKSRIVAQVSFNPAATCPSDSFGHGTHVAGIIGGNGAASNGAFSGVAPQVNLVDVKVSDDYGAASTAEVIAGLQWIYENKARYNIRVVNLSFNSTVAESYHTSPLDAALEILWFNGVVVVVSAGNNGDQADAGVIYPPANDPFVITVGASDDQRTARLDDNRVAPFSDYGITGDGFSKPDLVAPGVNLMSTLASQDMVLAQRYPDHIGFLANYLPYFRMSGTSMSAPVVSGAAALLLQDEPGLTPDQVKQRLMATANRSWPGYDPAKAGAGHLDIYAAVNGASLESANSGLTASQLLWTGSAPITWGSVAWNSVAWNSVAWNSVAWNSVAWNSVAWNSDYWGP